MTILSDSHTAGSLPTPSADAVAHSQRLVAVIAAEISAGGGWLSFARYMELALHAPGLGYYSAGTRKFGSDGDFITAPELGDLFARTLARQARQIIKAGVADILEVGPGSGRLACDLLSELSALDAMPRHYYMLEISADLRLRQQQLLQSELPKLYERVIWLDRLPESMEALVIANEALDVMPVHLIKTHDGTIDELGIAVQDGSLVWSAHPAQGAVLAEAEKLQLAEGYTTEIAIAASAFVRTLAAALRRGVMMFIDYGFPAREYYHPQRNAGTLMCHYRHRAHDDPLYLPGLQDITAHVDFSAIADSAADTDCSLLGYTNQAQFLINCGIADLISTDAIGSPAYVQLTQTLLKLTGPEQMGELFKVIALGKNFDTALLGFNRSDKRHTL